MPGDAERLAADAVVVGSGAGGAPVAAVLAESGRRVVVLEAGPRLEAGDFTGDEGEMTARLWKLAASTDAAMTFYGGACVGGSTVIKPRRFKKKTSKRGNKSKQPRVHVWSSGLHAKR